MANVGNPSVSSITAPPIMTPNAPSIAFDYRISRSTKSDGARSLSKSNAAVTVTIVSDAVTMTHERSFDGCETVQSARRMMSFEMLDWIKRHRVALSSSYVFPAQTMLLGTDGAMAGSVQFVAVDGHMDSFTVAVADCTTVQAAEDAAVAALVAVLTQAEAYFAGFR